MPGQPKRRAKRYARAHGLPWPPPPPVRTPLYLEECARAYDQLRDAEAGYEWALFQAVEHGESMSDIARKLGISRQAVSKYLKQHGNTPPAFKFTEEHRRRISESQKRRWARERASANGLGHEMNGQDHRAHRDHDQAQRVERDGH